MKGPGEGRTRSSLQRQCVVCQTRFKPHPRLDIRQKTCGQTQCRRKHRARYRRQYRAKNPEANQEYEQKRRQSRPPNFWKEYRRAHPASTERNRAQARLRKKLVKAGLQRQLDIVQLIDPPGKLASVVEFATSHRSLLMACKCQDAA